MDPDGRDYGSQAAALAAALALTLRQPRGALLGLVLAVATARMVATRCRVRGAQVVDRNA